MTSVGTECTDDRLLARHCRKTIQKVVYCVARRRALLPGRDGLVARRSAPTAG